MKRYVAGDPYRLTYDRERYFFVSTWHCFYTLLTSVAKFRAYSAIILFIFSTPCAVPYMYIINHIYIYIYIYIIAASVRRSCVAYTEIMQQSMPKTDIFLVREAPTGDSVTSLQLTLFLLIFRYTLTLSLLTQ